MWFTGTTCQSRQKKHARTCEGGERGTAQHEQFRPIDYNLCRRLNA